MKYLLDTNSCIFLINRHPAGVRQRFEDVPVGEVAVSTVTVSELLYGVEKSAKREQNLRALRKFLLPLVVLPYDAEASEQYGKLRVHLERAGTPTGSMDLMIAAHALAYNLTVVTNNRREFRRVPKLQVEDWLVL